MKIVVLSGAGMSAESGVPTFRGTDALWNGHRPEDVATPEAFRRDPSNVWEFYRARRRNLLDVRPNAGHLAVAGWQDRHDVVVATQNVDGLHQVAGSRTVHELHGSIWIARCNRCGREREDRVAAPADDALPTCPCGGVERPGVVWFGEVLPEETVRAAEQAVIAADLVLLVGSSNLVYPAASLPLLAISRRIPVVEVNPEETPFSGRVSRHMRAAAGEALPRFEPESWNGPN